MGAWLSWLERTVHIREVTGSSPVAPTEEEAGGRVPRAHEEHGGRQLCLFGDPRRSGAMQRTLSHPTPTRGPLAGWRRAGTLTDPATVPTTRLSPPVCHACAAQVHLTLPHLIARTRERERTGGNLLKDWQTLPINIVRAGCAAHADCASHGDDSHHGASPTPEGALCSPGTVDPAIGEGSVFNRAFAGEQHGRTGPVGQPRQQPASWTLDIK